MELQNRSKRLINDLDDLFNKHPESCGAIISHNNYSVILGNYVFENAEIFVYICDKISLENGYYVTYCHNTGNKKIIVKQFVGGWEMLPIKKGFDYTNVNIRNWVDYHKNTGWDICNKYQMELALK